MSRVQDGVVFRVWTVHRNNDERTNGPITDVCGTVELAKQVAAGTGWYGGDAGIEERRAISFAGRSYILAAADSVLVAYTFNDVKLSRLEMTRKRALSKLTDEDRAALGLTG